jgi:hypothetical protein
VVASEESYTADSRIQLDEYTAHVLRCSIDELAGKIYPMWPIDYYQAQAQIDALTLTPGRPKAYVNTYTPTLALDLYPVPRTQSVVRVHSVKSGIAFDPTVVATPMGLPDDVCWLAKYRAMDDLLGGDGLSRAPEASQYCTQRWQDGLEILEQYQSLMWSTLVGKRMTISSLGQLDAQRADWQNTSGTPRSLHMLNWNVFAVYPVPDGVYRLELEVVRKAPIPESDDDFIQVGLEQMLAIYDYAQHLAMFKCQGVEFGQTMGLYQSAKEAAMEHMAALAGSSVNWTQQQLLNREDRLMRPYQRRELVAEAGAQAKEAA